MSTPPRGDPWKLSGQLNQMSTLYVDAPGVDPRPWMQKIPDAN